MVGRTQCAGLSLLFAFATCGLIGEEVAVAQETGQEIGSIVDPASSQTADDLDETFYVQGEILHARRSTLLLGIPGASWQADAGRIFRALAADVDGREVSMDLLVGGFEGDRAGPQIRIHSVDNWSGFQSHVNRWSVAELGIGKHANNGSVLNIGKVVRLHGKVKLTSGKLTGRRSLLVWEVTPAGCVPPQYIHLDLDVQRIEVLNFRGDVIHRHTPE